MEEVVYVNPPKTVAIESSTSFPSRTVDLCLALRNPHLSNFGRLFKWAANVFM
jgi:hypothetical protein